MFKTGGKQMLKRTVACSLSAAMVFGAVPMSAIAEIVVDDIDDIVVVDEADGIALIDDTDSLYAQDAIASGTWGTCPWTIDSLGNLVVSPGNGVSQAGKKVSPWRDHAVDIKTVAFKKEGNRTVKLSGSAAYLFAQLYNTVSIDLSGLEATNITDMDSMFYECNSVRELDLGVLNTSAVTNMNDMFYDCDMLESINLSNFNTKSATDMNNMFHGCGKLKSLDLSSFNTAKVIDMNGMFYDCTNLATLNVSSFNTAKVTNMGNMFRGCNTVKTLDVKGFNTANVTNMHAMFSGCGNLTALDLSGFNTKKVTNMGYMFRGTDSLTQINLATFNTAAVTDMVGMFLGSGVKSLDLSKFSTSKLTDLSSMFYACSSLYTLSVAGWDTSHVTNFNNIFVNCTSLRELDLTSWDTSKAAGEGVVMFQGLNDLQKISLGNKFTITGNGMFPDATATNGKWWSTAKQDWLLKDVIVSGRSKTTDVYTSTPESGKKESISGAKITLDKAKYAWTGEGIKPVVTVMLGSLTLREGYDYTVSYKNNVNVGQGTATVTGIGSYKGTASAKFTITYAAMFKDVNEKTAHVEDIIWLANNGISKGWTMKDGSLEFRPYASVARADMAAFLFRLANKWGIVEDDWTPTIEESQAFADVKYETAHSREIRWLASVGISTGWAIKGSTKKEFRPYAQVARQDMAAFLFRLAKLAGKGGASDKWKASASSKTKFKDVDPNKATNHHDEVWWLAETHVSEGWAMSNGTYEFRGLRDVARADMAAFLHRMDGLA